MSIPPSQPDLWTPQAGPYLRMKPPLMAICSRSSTTRAGWLATTPSWLFPQALLAPLFILAVTEEVEEEEELASGLVRRSLLNLNQADPTRSTLRCDQLTQRCCFMH